MKNNKKLDEQIEDILNSMDNSEKATPKPYLFTRITARLNTPEASGWQHFAHIISRPGVIALGLCLLIGINITVILKHMAAKNTAKAAYVISTDEDDYAYPFVLIDNTENP